MITSSSFAKHTVTVLPTLQEKLEQVDFISSLVKSRVMDAIEKWGITSLVQLESYTRPALQEELKKYTQFADEVASFLLSLFPVKIQSLEEITKANQDTIELTGVFPGFGLRSKMIHEFTFMDRFNRLRLLQSVIDNYMLIANAKLLYLDANSTAHNLNMTFDVDVAEIHDIDHLEECLTYLDQGKYGLIIIDSLDRLLENHYSDLNYETFSIRAVRIQRIMHKLNLYAMRMNLIVIYCNEFNIIYDGIVDDKVKLSFILRGGIIVKYAPNNRFILSYEKDKYFVEVAKSDYIPLQWIPLSFENNFLDDMF